MVEVQHHLVDLVPARGALSATCSCGWTSVPAASEAHARKRWAIHSSQQHAVALCSRAMALGTSARVRSVELAVLTTQVRQRRARLAVHRAEVHRALWEADVLARPFRPMPSRTLDCARQLAGLSDTELWLRYISMGGCKAHGELVRTLRGEDALDDRDYDVLSAVLNEEFRLTGFGDPVPVRRRPPSIASGAG